MGVQKIMTVTIPTMLTIGRMVITPLIGVMIALQEWKTALCMLAAAVVSDMLDGYLARLLGQESALGACLDPLADKFLLLTCYGTLVFFPDPALHIPLWFLIVVTIKEALLLSGAVYFGLMRHMVPIRPLFMGKAAMAVQSILVAWLLACELFHWVPVKTFYVFLAISLIFVVGSLVQYVSIGYKKIREGVYL